MASRLQFRRDTKASWGAYDPVLADGEIGIERDSGRFKLGDGIKTWSLLPFSSNRLADDYFTYIDKEDTTNIEYGSDGEITKTTLANGCTVTYTYDGDKLIEMVYTDVDGTTNVAKKIFNYNDANQLTSVTKQII